MTQTHSSLHASAGTSKSLRSFPVASVSELPPGSSKIVEIDGKSIGVFNVHGEFYALRNVCPHRGAELCKGVVKPLVAPSSPGCFEYEREGEILRCPWHQWEFDIKTGELVVAPEEMHVKSYDVTVERFDVSVEEEQVCVHL